MSEWRETTLGEVLTLQRGFDLPKRDRVEGPYPIVSSSGITGHHSVAKVDPPGVVIGRYGSLGSVYWLNEPFWPHNTALWVKDFKGNDPRFISYLLRTINHDSSSAAAVPGVNRNHLHALPVRVPDVLTQRRIAAVLTAFDDLAEVNVMRANRAFDLVGSTFRSWVSGRNTEDTVARAGDVLQLRYGKALPAAARQAGDVAVVSSAGIIDEHDRALVTGPGIVVGRKGNVGSVWWVDRPFFPIDTTYFVESDVPLGVLYWLLRDMPFIDSHAAVPGLSRDQVYALDLRLPPAKWSERFDDFHRSAFSAMAAWHQQIRVVERTRDVLLTRVMSGRLDVTDIALDRLLPQGKR